MTKYNLEERLIDFSVQIINLLPQIQQDIIGKHLSGQLTRSGTAPSLLYGEAQSAESRADFIHKMKIGLKELRETQVCLKIILKGKLIQEQQLIPILKENNELIAIFVKSCQTARTNQKAEKTKR